MMSIAFGGMEKPAFRDSFLCVLLGLFSVPSVVAPQALARRVSYSAELGRAYPALGCPLTMLMGGGCAHPLRRAHLQQCLKTSYSLRSC